MTFNIRKFTTDHSIRLAEEHQKHYRDGWINLACPFCSSGEDKHHLGYCIADDYWTCYRCGWHSPAEVVRELSPSQISWAEAKQVVERYGGRPGVPPSIPQADGPTQITLPTGCGPLDDRHKKYLSGRNYDPDEITSIWKIQGTGPIGPYKFRIIAPIRRHGKMTSYQGRDVTGRSKAKYKACPIDKEVVPHKHSLYGLDQAGGHSVVVVEGIMDVWRLGPGAVATFGTQWTWPQVRLLKEFPRTIVMFDSGEEEARKKGLELAAALAGLGCSVEMATTTRGDPGNLGKVETLNFMKTIRG